MGAQLCGLNGSYQQLENQLLRKTQIQSTVCQNNSRVFVTIPIDTKYFPSPFFQSVNKVDFRMYFKAVQSENKTQIVNLKYFGLSFEEQQESQIKIAKYKALFYQGQFNNYDVKQGKGRAIFDNGDVYEGQWRDNSFQGTGIYTSNENNFIYHGQFKKWKKQGKGKIKMNGDPPFIYEGQFKNDQIQGKGKTWYPDGSIYQGEIKSGAPWGYGTFQKDNMKYEGSWKKGVMSGSGSCYWYSKERNLISQYTGQYKDGKKHGFGQYKLTNGKLFRGQWFEGKFNPGVNSYIIQ